MALQRLLDITPNPPEPEQLYVRLDFPELPAPRPYLYINMVSTADGKIVLGEAGGSAKGVGTVTDQRLFRRLQRVCDATLIGGSTLRASQVIYPPEKPRFVITRSGELPLDNRFFRDAPEHAYVLAPETLEQDVVRQITAKAKLIQVGQGSVDLPAALRILRQDYNIGVLLCEGGATLNDTLVRLGLVDELFLTLTNKIKGGSHLPTVVDGQGFSPGSYLPLTLISLYYDDSEIYLRYRLANSPVTI